MSGPPRSLQIAEPPAAYRVRPPLVVDCSTLAGLLFREGWSAQAADRIAGHALQAPYLLQAEIANVAVNKTRQGLAAVAAEGLAQFGEMEIDMYRIDAQAVAALAGHYRLTAYDAAYLWLATELKAPLATLDEKLAAAAQTHLSSLP